MHLTAFSSEQGTASFGVSLQGLSLADARNVLVEAGGAGFVSPGTTVSAYIGLNNELWGGTLIDSSTDFDWLSAQNDITANGTFSLQLLISLDNTDGGSASMDVDMRVPEPSVLALFGAGLIGLAGFARRRMK